MKQLTLAEIEQRLQELYAELALDRKYSHDSTCHYREMSDLLDQKKQLERQPQDSWEI